MADPIWSDFEAVDEPKADNAAVDWSDYEPAPEQITPQPVEESPTVILAKAKMAYAKQVGETMKQGPLFPIPRVESSNPVFRAILRGVTGQEPTEDTASSAAAAINVGKTLPEFVESPMGIVTAPVAGGAFGPLASRLAGLGFAGQMASEVPAAAKEAGRLSVEGTPQQRKEALLALTANVALPATLAAPPLAETIRSRLPVPIPEPIGPQISGSLLATPRGAPAPPPEPVPAPETVPPAQAAAQAQAMTAEATAGYDPRRLPTPRAGTPPVVPEGPSDPRVAVAREAGADTVAKVLKLFPEMKGSREAARAILKQTKEPIVVPEAALPEPAPESPPATAPQQPPIPIAEATAPEAPSLDLKSTSEASPEEFLKQSKAVTDAAMAGKGPSLQVTAENAFRANPDTEAWQKAYDSAQKEASDALAKVTEAVEKAKAEGTSPEEAILKGQEAMMGAAQKSQFFSEGLKLAKVPEVPKPEVVRGPATTADILGKVAGRLDAAEQAARARLASRRGKTTFGSGPLHEIPNIADYAIIGAAKIARGATEFAKWSGEMIKDFGDAIKPHLQAIFDRAQLAFDEHASVVRRVNQVLYEAGLPRRAIAEAGKKAVGKAIEAGAEAGRGLAEAEIAPKFAAIQEQLSNSIPKAQALREYFRGQEIGSAAGRKGALEEIKLADKWLEADARRIRDSLVEFANASLPVSERGRFLKAITDATKRPPILKGDPEAMYRRAASVAARIEDRATEVRKANIATEIKEAFAKAIRSPSVDIGYKKQIIDALKRVSFTKPLQSTVDALKSTRDFLTTAESAGRDVTIPKEVLDQLEVLGKIPARELPEHVLEAIRDKVNLLDQLGRLKVKARKQVWEIEKAGKLKELAEQATNPIQERPEFRQQPGDPRPLSVKIRNWANRQLNMGALLDKALLPIDALFDLLGDAKGGYKGWLFKNVRNPLDLDFNAAQLLRDEKTAPVEAIIKKNKLGERESERIGVYAAALQEGGIDRMVEMGVKPETIDNILKSITPAEMEAYQAMRKAMDSTLPEVQKLMHELYNIDVKPVPDYFPMPRDWNLYEPEPVPLKEPAYGKEMDFDELSGWKQMLGDFTSPKTTKSERGFTLERQKGAETPIKLNAFDVFQQHMNDVAYLLKTQRDLKMIGEMARGDLFKEKYGNVGQSIVTSWLDTVARQGKIGGFRRIPMLDELRRRTSAGVIGFRLASQFVHLSNIPLAVWRAGGPLWWKAGLGEALSERGQAFLKDNFAETFTRGGGEPALVEASQSDLSLLGKRIVPKAVVQASFAIARKIDQYNAQATTLGIYLRLLAEKGLDAKNYDKIPVDKEAQAQALVLSRRAVASPLPKDVSASLSRGAITGGNVSLGRTIFQFQNIFQDQWSNIRHDLARAGIREKNPKLAATAFVAITAMLLAEMGIRETSKQIISSATGYKPKKEQDPQERIALEAARRIPFGGQATSQILYGETGVPVIDSILATEKAVKQVVTAKKDATKQKALIRAAAGAAQLGGVPGASQVGELLEKAQ